MLWLLIFKGTSGWGGAAEVTRRSETSGARRDHVEIISNPWGRTLEGDTLVPLLLSFAADGLVLFKKKKRKKTL